MDYLHYTEIAYFLVNIEKRFHLMDGERKL